MTHTTVADYEEFAGQTFDPTKQARVEYNLRVAERALFRRVTVDFFTAGDEALAPSARSAASLDWIDATCILAAYYLIIEDPEVQADMLGPYQSERLGDYAYTLRPAVTTKGSGKDPVFKHPRLQEIIATYHPMRLASGYAQFSAGGPVYGGTETAEIVP